MTLPSGLPQDYAGGKSAPVCHPITVGQDFPCTSVAFPNYNFTAQKEWDDVSKFMGECTDAKGVDYCSNCGPQKEYDNKNKKAGIYMSRVSGFLMFIPFGLIGLGEILVN